MKLKPASLSLKHLLWLRRKDFNADCLADKPPSISPAFHQMIQKKHSFHLYFSGGSFLSWADQTVRPPEATLKEEEIRPEPRGVWTWMETENPKWRGGARRCGGGWGSWWWWWWWRLPGRRRAGADGDNGPDQCETETEYTPTFLLQY